jgi:beta-glucosidase
MSFLWGVATSAYQIEGATREDGRGACIWDGFDTPAGESGERACDFYHRSREDIALMRRLGIDVFRFSISWARVVPEGRGAVNVAGLDFYDRLVDDVLAAGIRPFATLYHFDLPQRLEDEGGWPARETAEAFAEYAAVVARRLGDRVPYWATHNEPWCTSWLGYVEGVHAPGRTDPAAGAAAAHHVLLSHGLAVEAIRREAPEAQVGILLDFWPQHAASDDARDVAAARAADGSRNRLFVDAVLSGRYPADVLERLGAAAPPVREGDLATIAAPIDFLGVHYYSRNVVRAGPDGRPVGVPPSGPLTAMGWEVYPEGMYEVLMRLHREYDAPPLWVTENGMACADTLDDDERIAFLRAHLERVFRAIGEGVPVLGYLVWSLLDNFEWSEGYAKRFGLVRVDYETFERTPRQSFEWYRELVYSLAATR